ncbi:MAG: glycosyltransferase family 4 protein [Candidatus Cloacimonadota bacterium]|nr:glycosyltransferase family 4 protein [Candidatus Cloacimonadota bacterium]
MKSSNNSKSKKILFCSALYATYINKDYKILNRYFPLYKIISPGLKGLIRMLRYLPKVRVSFIWFASIHAGVIVFLSKFMKKKTIVALGGFDVAKEKEIRYGIWTSWWRSVFVGYAIRNADYVLAVDISLKKKATKLAKYDGGNIKVIPFGFNSEHWKPGLSKEDYILSVAYIDTPLRIKVKGIDILLKIASMLLSFKFKIVGVTNNIINLLEDKTPPNVELIQPLKQDELLSYFQRAKIYCQLSWIEGLPNVLCEAMLCGCLPIGTNVGGIPQAIGETGWIVEYGDVKGTADVITDAMRMDTKKGLLCRQRIIQMFSEHQREKKLIEIIEKCLI